MGRGDRRHSRDGRGGRVGWLVAVVLVLALAGGAAVAWRTGTLDDLVDRYLTAEQPDPVTEPAAVPPPEGVEAPGLPEPEPVAAAASGGTMRPAAVRRALARGLADPDLGRSVHVAVADLERRNAPAYTEDTATRSTFTPASTMKLATSLAALEALGPDHRFETTVVARGRALTLVGGGDPTLERTPDEASAGVPDLATLARRTAEALAQGGKAQGGRKKVKPVRLSYDATLFTGPSASSHWRADYVPDDIVSPITALWVDEGLSPDHTYRFDDPAAAAADVFAAALREAGVPVAGPVTARRAPRAAEEVAAVESPPLSQVVEHVLEVSDNEGAEVLAHHVGAAVEGEASFTGGAAGVRRTLDDLGVPLRGVRIHDGSGLARDNLLAAETLLGVLRAAGDPDRPELRAVLTGLPVAGFTGSLALRFDTGPEAAVGRVRAKTGSLTGVRSLAGVAVDQRGTPLAFVLAADRIKYLKTEDAEQALDEVAAEIAACRCSR
ncbi:D-alanyl-D-alanine carboxypeptidase/D-alanyl-D-alanine-endopeptidase [Nocardioides aestuarii]|uniref:D-alanyl-D-alanine carboxypeptidase/D-alanyl-D-alanine-endopeptidase n=1 Tax=Nocardioides aestuarii TaxID=252231 RepID=A0ABW4TPI0_9ACTN